jgi:protein gp37
MKRKGNKIGWCDKTCNPVTGCPNGCEYCYARKMNDRFHWVEEFSKPQFFPNRLKEFRTREPMIVFIDSMSDIAHWEFEWFRQTVHAMYDNPQNIYLALTKNIGKFKAEKQSKFSLPARFFIGATVTNNAQAQAVIDAGGADFISFEPLLEPIDWSLLECLKCKWWIVGDLTNGRPLGVTKFLWVAEIAAVACIFGIPLYMKDSLRDVMGDCMVQEFPAGWIRRVSHDSDN